MIGKALVLTIISLIIVPETIEAIHKRANKNTTGTIYDFTMAPLKHLAYLGISFNLFMLICLIFAICFDQLNIYIAIAILLFTMFGAFLTLAPVKGFWSTTISGDEVISSRLWIFKTHAKISDIAKVKISRGGLTLYNDKGNKLFAVDMLCENLSLFYERMEKEGIEIPDSNESQLEK